MKKIFIGVVLAFFLLLDGFEKSYGQFTIDAEFRPRTELRSGFSQPMADSLSPGFATLMRTRLNFNYSAEILKARITLQDSRVFGETDIKQPSSATTGSLGIFEAWAELIFLKGASFKIGRQGLQFEDGRMFAVAPWSNNGKSHDLVQLIYGNESFNAELGFAYNNQSVYNADSSYYSVSKTYKQLAFLHLVKKFDAGIDITMLGVSEGFVTSKTNLDLYFRYSIGGTVKYEKKGIPVNAIITGYYQTGKSKASVDLDAYLLALKVTYSVTPKIKVAGGIDYFSGSESTLESSMTNTFNKLPYGTNHAFYGYMEYWGTIPKGGLVKYFIGPSLKLTDQISSNITWYGFALDKAMTVSSTEVKGSIGSELDVALNYSFSPEATVQFAWCSYFTNDNTFMLKYGSTSVDVKFPQYAYVMFTFKPKFFKNL